MGGAWKSINPLPILNAHEMDVDARRDQDSALPYHGCLYAFPPVHGDVSSGMCLWTATPSTKICVNADVSKAAEKRSR